MAHVRTWPADEHPDDYEAIGLQRHEVNEDATATTKFNSNKGSLCRWHTRRERGADPCRSMVRKGHG